jgi:hypothetical protein
MFLHDIWALGYVWLKTDRMVGGGKSAFNLAKVIQFMIGSQLF